MNKKAFTLIEVLATIVILGVLSAIVFINVNGYIQTSRETSYDTLVKTIKLSAELYVSEHSNEFPQLEVSGSMFYIELIDLVNADYLDEPIVDERTGEEIPLTTKVNITVINKNDITIDLDY
ncbi:MAG: type II secretion system protein [Bacilli bacterium]|nr:type II secretion system protein [Bacilli bacterium]MDD3305114.1 type II secretion system protein [Bacilli bacterium]MDD4053353.1 type II secretion system protein [Bacilli bacterium]MDD4411000.1 type II secretion system protein [Bacilli bacterium]